jgi:hypothetical protein
MSRWISSPAWRRQYLFAGSGGSSRDSRLSPTRASTAHTVDTARPSSAAIIELVLRSRRNATIAASTAAEVRAGDECGREDRSVIGSPRS